MGNSAKEIFKAYHRLSQKIEEGVAQAVKHLQEQGIPNSQESVRYYQQGAVIFHILHNLLLACGVQSVRVSLAPVWDNPQHKDINSGNPHRTE